MSDKEKPIRLFITGLCLQGNKGGPALALSMREVLSHYLSLNIITLSVPGEADFVNEQRAAKRYGFKVVETIDPKSLLKCHFARARIWFDAFMRADVVIDMTAISYVGPPVGRLGNIFGGRFFYFLIGKLLFKKFLAWTQSYGPLSTPLVRQLAKLDLRCQPVVFCRGDNCSEAIRGILPSSDIRSFPDVATILPYDKAAGRSLLENLVLKKSERLVTISPSAVIYGKTAGKKGANAHVVQTARLCDWLTAEGWQVVLLPHTLRHINVVPENCDLEVCKLIYAAIKNKQNCSLVSDDIGPVELKNVIANAQMHIGGRYHSIVAALSTGVPCVSLAWHPKYKDLMSTYGVAHFVFDATADTSAGSLISLTQALAAQRHAIHQMLGQQQTKVAALVEENASLFSQIIQGG